jgi:hypothetical protein
MDRHSLILWARSKDIDLDGMADIAYPMLRFLKNYGEGLDPRYLPGGSPSLVKEFVCTWDNVKAYLNEGVDREGFRLFGYFTTIVSFISSCNQETFSSISLNIGNSGPLFSNAFVIDLSKNFLEQYMRCDDFIALFRDLTELFEPFYGFVYGTESRLPDAPLWQKNRPNQVYWLNYYNQEIAEVVGLDAVLTVPGVERVADGYFFQLPDGLIDTSNPLHLQKRQELMDHLGL